MSILTLILYLALIGLLTWVIITYIPMPQAIKTLILIVVIVLVVIWILQLIGLNFPSIPRIK